MPSIPPPPVPQGLRDMLKDYPEHIRALQEALNETMAKPFGVTPLYEQALWALEGMLDVFVGNAQVALKAAKREEDLAAIEKAEQTLSVMRRAGFKSHWVDENGGLWDYCQRHDGALM